MSKKATVHHRHAVGSALPDLNFKPCFEAGLDGMISKAILPSSDAARIATAFGDQRTCLSSPFADDNYFFGEVAVFEKVKV